MSATGPAPFSAADQARFFSVFDRLTPPAARLRALSLLSSIVSYQRWGFSRFSLAEGFKTFFKGGWRGTSRGSLVHEAALFERGPLRISMAVLTDGNPSTATAPPRCGESRSGSSEAPRSRPSPCSMATPGHASRRRPRADLRGAGLVDVHRHGPGIQAELAYRTRNNLTGRRLPGYCENWALLRERAARDLGRVQRHRAAGGWACWCSTRTGRRAPPARWCVGPVTAAGRISWARTSRSAAATTRAPRFHAGAPGQTGGGSTWAAPTTT